MERRIDCGVKHHFRGFDRIAVFQSIVVEVLSFNEGDADCVGTQVNASGFEAAFLFFKSYIIIAAWHECNGLLDSIP